MHFLCVISFIFQKILDFSCFLVYNPSIDSFPCFCIKHEGLFF